MDGTGEHHVKQSKPDSERQKLHVSSHMWKTDPKYKITKMIIYKKNMFAIVGLF
jgi:hypothetical protein